MPIKVLKTETPRESSVERIMYTRRYRLILDKKRCIGCEICRIVCPKEAITVTKPVKAENQKAGRPKISIDENKCHFCGVCTAICPFGAFTLQISGKEAVPVLETESFPQIIHEIEVDENMCPADCKKCEETCPLGLIKVGAGEAVGEVKVNIDKEHCPGCRLCEAKCPEGAIHVRKSMLGSIKVNAEKCPENCRDCVDVCPIPDVLYVAEDGKVHVNSAFCVYCGACKAACPVEGAVEVRRSMVNHTPVRSGAWNKALEKLTSTNDVSKELRGKLMTKAQETVRKRFAGRAQIA
jgi:4Fe-4S ferredoxin